MVALYSAAGLTSPALLGKGVNKWSSHAEKEDAVAAGMKTTAGASGVVFGGRAETTKVKLY